VVIAKNCFCEPYAELLSTRESQKVTWLLGASMIAAGCMALALALFHPLQLFGPGVIGELTDATAVLAEAQCSVHLHPPSAVACQDLKRPYKHSISKGLVSLSLRRRRYCGLSFIVFFLSYMLHQWPRGVASWICDLVDGWLLRILWRDIQHRRVYWQYD